MAEHFLKIAFVPVLASLALVGAGCGGDDEKSQTVPPAPELTTPADDVPTIKDSTRDSTSTTGDGAGAPSDEGGGAEAPSNDGGQSQQQQQQSQGGGAQPDSPQNDTPPPQGSPAEKFENFCSENPGAC